MKRHSVLSSADGALERFAVVRFGVEADGPGSWLNAAGLDLPDALAVVADRAVGRELAHARGVEDRLARPGARIAPERADSILRVDVRLVVGQQEKGIVIEQIRRRAGERVSVSPSAKRAAAR